MPTPEPVRAAGGLVVRHDGRVAIVHRPRHADWSLPKGKLEREESWEDAALREVHEETGIRAELVEELPANEYVDDKGRPKRVRWWRMRAVGDDGFTAGDEVDELRWATPADAAALLTYEHDRRLVQHASG